MPQVIIYKQDNGSMAVIYPTPEALALYGVVAIADKDVPTGKPYKIIDASEVPERSQRDTWAVDDAALTDGVGSDLDHFE